MEIVIFRYCCVAAASASDDKITTGWLDLNVEDYPKQFSALRRLVSSFSYCPIH